MSLLIDTHVWIWSQGEQDKIGRRTRGQISEADRMYVSTTSTLEIARLIEHGLLGISADLEEWITRSLESLRCEGIGLSREVALGAYQLPGKFHRNPADRILVSKARAHGLTLVTADRRILRYRGVKIIDARR